MPTAVLDRNDGEGVKTRSMREDVPHAMLGSLVDGPNAGWFAREVSYVSGSHAASCTAKEGDGAI